MNLKICIFASGKIAIPMIKQLFKSKNLTITGLITQPSRPVGRKRAFTPTAVGKWAIENNISFIETENINTENFMKKLINFDPNMLLVFSYGQLLKKKILNFCKYGAINIHGSLLPVYRGASPINACIIEEKKTTGISIIKMVQKLDNGPIFIKKEISITKDDTYLSLHDKIAHLSAKYIEQTLLDIATGKLQAIEQNENFATFTSKISSKDGLINWSKSAQKINQLKKAYHPWPGIYFFLNKKRFQITECRSIDSKTNIPIGQLSTIRNSIFVQCGEKTALNILEFLLEGKKIMKSSEFLRGNYLKTQQI